MSLLSYWFVLFWLYGFNLKGVITLNSIDIENLMFIASVHTTSMTIRIKISWSNLNKFPHRLDNDNKSFD